MRSVTTKETYSDGQIIFKEGTFGEATYLILTGKVAISVMIGGAKITIAHLKRGDILGQISLIDKQARSATAVAIGEVELGIIDKDFLENEINKTSKDFRMILNGLSDRLRETTGQLINMTMKYHQLKNKLDKISNETDSF